MTANEKETANAPEYNAVDVKFIFECVKNLDEDKMVDLSAVAAGLGYKNVASVYNRLRSLRKKYGIDNLEGRMNGTSAKLAPAKEDKEDNSSSDATVDEQPKPKRKRGDNPQSAKGSSKPAPAAKGARAGKGAKRGPKPKQGGGVDTAVLASVDVAAEDA
ncbi:hypothetical protein BJX96DRAFT_179792 [Aspergillus floccosus]